MKLFFCDDMLFSHRKDTVYDPIEYPTVKFYQLADNLLERGSEIYEHTQIFNEISLITSGEGEFFVDGKKQTVKPGDIHIISNNHTHKIIANKASRLRFINLGFMLLENTGNPIISEMADFYNNVGYALVKDNGTVLTFLNSFINELYLENEYSYELYESYIKLVIVSVFRFCKPSFINRKRPEIHDFAPVGGTVFTILKYIDINIKSIRHISDVSKALNFSAAYMSRVFKEKMGITIHEYFSQKKIEAAIELMKSQNLKMKEISEYLNFESYGRFNRLFKQYTGKTPFEYAKNLENQNT